MSGGTHKDKNLLATVETAVTPAARSTLPAILWNWHTELGFLALLGAAAGAIAQRYGLAWLAVITGTVLAAMLGLLSWSPARNRMIGRAWCLVTPHRVRAGCAQAWVQTRTGRLPIIIWTSPADHGERVLLWCRAGITPRDLAAARDVLAVACWASDIRVLPHRRYPHLVRLEVVRNQPSRVVAIPSRHSNPGEESADPGEEAGIRDGGWACVRAASPPWPGWNEPAAARRR